MCERESVGEREREKERVCVCERERERERVCVRDRRRERQRHEERQDAAAPAVRVCV